MQITFSGCLLHAVLSMLLALPKVSLPAAVMPTAGSALLTGTETLGLQGSVLHAVSIVSPCAASQTAPPYACCCEMLKVAVVVPPPHDALQGFQPPQLPTQLTGQGPSLHAVVSVVPFAGVQSAPLCSAGLLTTKVRVQVPPPQDALQELQAPQSPTQSTGQGDRTGSHARVCTSPV